MKAESAGVWVLTGGVSLILYGMAVRYDLRGFLPDAPIGGSAGIVLIFAGLVLLAGGAVLRLGD